jgi:hypothetical protein
MTLQRLIENLFVRDKTISINLTPPNVAFAGTLNIEFGFAEFKSQHFAECESCGGSTSVVLNCDSCGRKSGNNLQFLAGRGDGVYSGITLLDGEGVLACMYVFDEDNEMSEAILPQLNGRTLQGNNFQMTLFESIAKYFNLPAFELGNIQASFNEARDVGFIAADSGSGSGKFATVDHPFSNGNFTVYLFMEPIYGKAQQDLDKAFGVDNRFGYDNGYKEAMRPRVAFIVKKDFEDLVMQGVEIKKANWTKQSEVWKETSVMSNMSRIDGAPNFYNGLFWQTAAQDQLEIMGESDEINEIEYIYRTRALGYFIMGALCGIEEAKDLAMAQIDHFSRYEGMLSDELFSDALEPRGLEISDEILALLDIVPTQETKVKNNFCTSCGKKYDELENFCAECGTKRN